MSVTRTESDIESLRQRVQQKVDRECTRKRLDFRLIVKEASVEEEEWVYVIVVPDREGVRAYDYAKVLSDVELELRRDEHEQHVLILPALDD